MTKIELRFHQRNKKNCAYFKPVGDDRDRGSSVRVNQTFVSEYFRGISPEKARPTLIVRSVETPWASPDARSPKMTKIELRYHHTDNGNFSYYKPVGDDRAPGPSLFVDQTFISAYFRGMDPQKARPTLILETVSGGRAGVGS